MIQNKKPLKIQKRKEMKNLKKVLVTGLDKTGKSHFAHEYCKKYGLKPIVIDIDNTNFEDDDIILMENYSSGKFFVELKNILLELKENTDYDTVVLDGLSSVTESLIGSGSGLTKYSERSEKWAKIRGYLLDLNKNLILIAQEDFNIETYNFSEQDKPNKIIIQVNSMVNEKYETKLDKGKYIVNTISKRGV